MFLGESPVSATLRLQTWWKPKAANLLTIVYSVALIAALPFLTTVRLIIAAVITILGIGAFGHVINDWCDIRDDALAGKANRLAGLYQWQRSCFAFGLLALGLAPWLVLPRDVLSIGLLIVEFALLLAYAVAPLRLKKRVIPAILADAAYAYAVPALLAAHTFFLAARRTDSRVLVMSMVVWQSALGARHYLNHLALDRLNDIGAGISTLATLKGNRFIHDLIRTVFLPIELLGFLGYLLVMNQHVSLLLFLVVGIFSLTISFHAVLAVGRAYPLLSYRFSHSQLDWFYQNALPLVLLFYLLLLDWKFGALLLAHALIFFTGFAHFTVRILAWPIVLALNPFRREINPTRTVTGGVPALPTSLAESVTPQARGTNIAIVNINKGKYTETFVDGLMSRLHYNVFYLYGGELPIFDNEGRHFLSNWPSLQSLAQFLEAGLHLEKDQLLRSSISAYLQAKRIHLVLAEFGPVGVEMLPIARDLGIPLIVYFHGYDAFHDEVLGRRATQYSTLFREAARVVGVSETMLEQLKQLGCPPEKLVHLPAFVDLERFPYSDHSLLPPRFLAVGRFAETKSPHLTLLAFYKVSHAIPEATLTMIGKGGGGELFEACLILARALGLEDRVEFRGVLGHDDVAREMRQARVFVQHSVTTPEHGDMEGKPVAVMEAMASGLPVVATRHSGILELVEHEVSGLLVPEYDVDGMATAMIRLAQDDSLVRQLGQRASTFIHQHPLISRHVEILEKIIESSIRGADQVKGILNGSALASAE